MEDRIDPFDPAFCPIRDVRESIGAIEGYVYRYKLAKAAGARWHELMGEPQGDKLKRALLKHLYDQVADAMQEQPPKRFRQLRDYLDAYEDAATFSALVSTEPWDELSGFLQWYIALYVYERSEEPRFSSDTFYRRYLEAHPRRDP